MRHVASALLSASLLIAAPSSEAVELGASHDFGEVLLFPYFTASGATIGKFATVLTLSSAGTSEDSPDAGPVAVRVAVRLAAVDGIAPAPVMLNVLLRPNDSWTLVAASDLLHSVDSTCVIAQAGTTTSGFELPLAHGEGWIEVFELGRVISPDVVERLARPDRPAACAELAELLPTLSATGWLSAPDNRLRGTSHFIDVAAGTSFTATPIVLRDFRDAPIYASAAEDSPTLAEPAPARARVVLADGEWRTSSFASRPVDAVTAVLMSTEWELDFELSPELAARTDVVLTMPTRRWYVDGAQGLTPFNHPTRASGAFELNAQIFDREGTRPSIAAAKCTPAFPVHALGPLITSDQTTLKLGDDSALHSEHAQQLTYPVRDTLGCAIGGLVSDTLPDGEFVNGRATLQFVDGPRAPSPDTGFGQLVSDEGHVFLGLPVIGTAVTTVVNGFLLPGVLANYGLQQPIVRRTQYPEMP